MQPNARAQTILGKSTWDKFMPVFWEMNTNANSAVLGINLNASIPLTNAAIKTLLAGSGVTLTPGAGNTLTIASTGGGGGGSTDTNGLAGTNYVIELMLAVGAGATNQATVVSNGVIATMPMLGTLNTDRLRPIVQRFKGGQSPPVRVLAIGDSMSEFGAGWFSSANRMFEDLSSVYNNRWEPFMGFWAFLPGGVANPAWVSTNWWTGATFGVHAGGFRVGSLTYSNINQITVIWLKGPYGNSSLQITTNDVLCRTVDGYSATWTAASTNITVGFGNYYVGCATETGTETNVVLGSTGQNTTNAGVSWYYTSKGGATIQNLLDVPTNVLGPVYSAINPDVIFYHAKDWGESGNDPVALKTLFTNLYSRISPYMPNAVWCLVGTPNNPSVSATNGPMQNLVYYNLCKSSNWVYLDASIPDPQYTNLWSIDGLHPNKGGAQRMAQALEVQMGFKGLSAFSDDGITNLVQGLWPYPQIFTNMANRFGGDGGSLTNLSTNGIPGLNTILASLLRQSDTNAFANSLFRNANTNAFANSLKVYSDGLTNAPHITSAILASPTLNGTIQFMSGPYVAGFNDAILRADEFGQIVQADFTEAAVLDLLANPGLYQSDTNVFANSLKAYADNSATNAPRVTGGHFASATFDADTDAIFNGGISIPAMASKVPVFDNVGALSYLTDAVAYDVNNTAGSSGNFQTQINGKFNLSDTNLFANSLFRRSDTNQFKIDILAAAGSGSLPTFNPNQFGASGLGTNLLSGLRLTNLVDFISFVQTNATSGNYVIATNGSLTVSNALTGFFSRLTNGTITATGAGFIGNAAGLTNLNPMVWYSTATSSNASSSESIMSSNYFVTSPLTLPGSTLLLTYTGTANAVSGNARNIKFYINGTLIGSQMSFSSALLTSGSLTLKASCEPISSTRQAWYINGNTSLGGQASTGGITTENTAAGFSVSYTMTSGANAGAFTNEMSKAQVIIP